MIHSCDNSNNDSNNYESSSIYESSSRHFTVIQNKELLGKINLVAKEAAKQQDIDGIKEIANNEKYNHKVPNWEEN